VDRSSILRASTIFVHYLLSGGNQSQSQAIAVIDNLEGKMPPEYKSIKRMRNLEERARVVEKLLILRAQLDEEIPKKTATDTLLLATWNIREFGNNKSDESLQYLAEIISRFDLVAIQEVARELDGLKKLVSMLGHNWDYIVTDSTEGTAGGGERMAFVFDKCKVFFDKMAGELVLPYTKLIESGDKKLQFARTPFSVAFGANWFQFVLTTVHILYGSSKKEDPQRVKEIAALAEFLKERAKKENANYILLGDFNIFKTSDATMKALEKGGFYIPQAIRQHPSDLGRTKHYDQIAFKLRLDDNMPVFTEGNQRAGAFDFSKSVYRPEDLDLYRGYFDKKNVEGKTEAEIKEYYLTYYRTFQMSDHLPLWIELKIDFSTEFLKKIIN